VEPSVFVDPLARSFYGRETEENKPQGHPFQWPAPEPALDQVGQKLVRPELSLSADSGAGSVFGVVPRVRFPPCRHERKSERASGRSALPMVYALAATLNPLVRLVALPQSCPTQEPSRWRKFPWLWLQTLPHLILPHAKPVPVPTTDPPTDGFCSVAAD
jgi:hypothetical protein